MNLDNRLLITLKDKLEVSSSVQFLISIVFALASTIIFVIGTILSAQNILNMSAPPKELVVPMSLFVIGFIGILVSTHFMFNYGETWGYED